MLHTVFFVNEQVVNMKHSKKRRRLLGQIILASFSVALITIVFLLASPAVLFPVRVQAAENQNNLSEHTIDTVSPAHVKFNLFDYWLVDRATSSHGISDANFQSGINKGHAFVFGSIHGWGPWNVWTGFDDHYNAQSNNSNVRYGTYPGIVENQLQDGYPILDINTDHGGQAWVDQHHVGDKLNESLAYLFDPNITNDYKVVYENVQGLVKYDNNGGYIYNSHENYAAFQELSPGTIGTNGEPTAGYFDVYDNWALEGSSSPNGQFFPFDGANEVFKKNSNGSFQVDQNGHLVSKNIKPAYAYEDSKNLNHFFGLTMETIFLQPENGKIDADTPMYFTFSGDDDVWIYIDNVLVSDLGGIHDECFTIIDFETGKVYTGLTPVTKNSDGTFSENIPTLEELRSSKTGKTWSWYNRIQGVTVTGSYDQYAAAHGITEKTLKDIFDAAGQSDTQAWGTDGMSEETFDQNTQHELKMFYLERGAGASNLVLSFNMLAVPASGITKTDQDGRPVEGATFALWPAQVSETEKDQYGHALPLIDEETGLYIANKSNGTPICTATTDENGHLSFVTENHKIISFQERAQDDNFYYVLEEIARPIGYRSKGDISLYYSLYNPNNASEGVLLSYNYWETGAYTQAKLDVTLTEDLYRYELDETGQPVAETSVVPEGEDKNSYLDDGIIFAVPIKRMDKEGSLYDESNYHAIYGTANTGWTMMTKDITDKNSVLEAAKGMERVIQETRQAGTIIAERNARQLFHVELTNIPGDVKDSYPYLMGTGNEENSEFNVAFYFAPNAETFEDVNPDTIVRLSAATPDGKMFDRQYASLFYISNSFNRFRIQKLDYHGDRLTDAEFSLYQTYSTWKRNDNYVLVEDGSPDTSHIGMYRNTDVVDGNGNLKSREAILQTTPWDKGTTKSGGTAGSGSLDLDGAFIFPTAFNTYIFSDQHLSKPYQVNPGDTSTYLEEGEYVVFETTAPSDGYLINETPTPVVVNDNGVFADAGGINDGVRVGQYAGWVLNSMAQFATEGAVDETLTFLSSTLKVQNENGSLDAPIEGDITWLNKYSNENDRYIFLAEDIGQYITDGRNLYQFTDQGTPQLQIQQNSGVMAQVILFDGKYAGYKGIATVNKKNADGTIYPLQGIATDGTLSFWLSKGEVGSKAGAQTFDSVQINGEPLVEGVDYHVYAPSVIDLSGYDDLSGLFSVETLVQVYDQSVGDLVINKTVEKIATGSDADEEWFFYRVYSVYEHATRIVLAETDENGSICMNEDNTPVLNTTFDGTLNVRLRQEIEGESFQMTATDVSVDFTNGVGLIYLEPSYMVEHIYIPQNQEHPAHGLIGLVETEVVLDNTTVNGSGQEIGQHIAFDIEHNHSIQITNGVGYLYHDPAYNIVEVKINGETYYSHPEGDQKKMTVTSRFTYANIGQVQNLSVDSEVAINFTEADGSPSSADRVLTQTENQTVTVVSDNSGGYLLKYNLPSDTHEQAVVAQFALRGGQTAHIENLAGGTVYYIYEYAAGDGDEAGGQKLADDWTTEIEITPQSANNGTEEILDQYEEVIQDRLPGYRAARGLIRPNSTQRVDFTNISRSGELKIQKTVTGDQITDDDLKTSFTFTITLTDENRTPLKGTYPYTGSSTSQDISPPANGNLTLDAKGSATITLTHGQAITIQNIPKDMLYAVSESTASGYTTVVGGDEDADGLAEGTIVENEVVTAAFTNIRQSTLTFIKVAAEDHSKKLSGAEFVLFRLSCTDSSHDHTQMVDAEKPGNCWQKVSSQTSAEDGKVTFPQLEPLKTYRLIETKAPDGYALPEGQWTVVTDAQNAIQIKAIGGENGRLPTAFAVEEGTGKLLLPNAKPVDLPSSGGRGELPFLLAGGALMLTVAGVFLGKLFLGKRSYGKHAA